MSIALYNKYRPLKFADVLGQDAVVASLQKVIKRGDSQAYLLSGPSGVGKTTLARIAAREAGCSDQTIKEIDAANNSGVDATREVAAAINYRPFGDVEFRANVVDECHNLSKSAWDSLLKVVEEPPDHALWFFCTTNLTKVPATIKTRCTGYALKLVPEKKLWNLLDDVCDKEKIKINDDVAGIAVEMAFGSPRQLLVNLAMVRDIESRKEAQSLLKAAAQSEPQLELCRFLLQGKGSWDKVMRLVEKLADESPESVRIAVVNYMAKAMRGAKSDNAAINILRVLEAFAEPYNSNDGQAKLIISIGRALLG